MIYFTKKRSLNSLLSTMHFMRLKTMTLKQSLVTLCDYFMRLKTMTPVLVAYRQVGKHHDRTPSSYKTHPSSTGG